MAEDHTERKPEEMEVSVIIPTYCEAQNLPLLIPRIFAALQEASLQGEIIVVDDNSPDDTEKVCAELATANPVRLIIRRNERGLSSAVLEGMKQGRGEVLLVMDADLSHPPEKVPELVRAVGPPEIDFAIGSRYVKGGGTDEAWGWFRKLNSKVAGWLARPLTKACDPMAGFFALKRSRFEAAEELDPIGYKIGLELIVKGKCKNIVEIPIHFTDRCHGQSKMSLREQFNYLRHLRRLYVFQTGTLAEATQFILVGLTGMIVDLVVFSVLLHLVPISIGRALAIWIAMSWNYGLNRKITFSHKKKRNVLPQYFLFCLSCGVGALVSWSVFVGLHSTFPFFSQWPMIAAFAGIIGGTLSNFLLSKHIAFK